MNLKTKNLITAVIAALSMTYVANAATITISALDVRANGIFGTTPDADPVYGDHQTNVSGATINGAAPGGTVIADPIDIAMTYSNLDLDGDASANDSVTFTLRASGGGGGQRIFNQGVDTGFGSLNDVTISMLSVSGTTTDSGDTIVFDGFTGGAAGMGSSAAHTRNVDINGTTVNMSTPGGGFIFDIAALDFAPTPTVLFDNSGGSGGSVVARHYDLQFSTIPEPSSLVVMLLGLTGLHTLRRRR